MLTFKNLLVKNILVATAASVHEHLQAYESSSQTSADVTYMLGDVETQLLSNLNHIDFQDPYCKTISSMFEEIIDFIPEFTSEHIHLLTRMFHYLNHQFNNVVHADKHAPTYPAFEPTLLFKALASNKFKANDRDILIKRILSVELDSKIIGLSSNSLYSKVLLKLSDDLFKDISVEDKHNLLVEFVKLNANEPVNNWSVKNLGYLANVVFKEDARELGKELFLNTLPTIPGAGEKPNWIIDNNSCLIRPRNNSDYYNVRYVHQGIGHHIGLLGLIDKLRTYMCDGLDNYKNMRNTAEALDCEYNSEYWSIVLNTHRESVIDYTGPKVEF